MLRALVTLATLTSASAVSLKAKDTAAVSHLKAGVLALQFQMRSTSSTPTKLLRKRWVDVREVAIIRRAFESRPGGGGRSEAGAAASRFHPPFQMMFGRPADAALGLAPYMNIDSTQLARRIAEGKQAIIAEVMRCGDDEVIENLDYVLHKEAGSSPQRFQGGLRRDCGEDGRTLPERLVHGLFGARGKRLQDFVRDARARDLSEAHVLALRLYSTAAFKLINAPLRRAGLASSEKRAPHPLPATCAFIAEAIKRLRAVESEGADANEPLTLWRGAHGGVLDESFVDEGGTEVAVCSTTTELEVAAAYSAACETAPCALLFRMQTSNFMDRGASIDWLSAFPAEREICFPPLTYLQPTGRPLHEEVLKDGRKVTVCEVAPRIGS